MNAIGTRARVSGAVPARLDCDGAVAELPSQAQHDVA